MPNLVFCAHHLAEDNLFTVEKELRKINIAIPDHLISDKWLSKKIKNNSESDYRIITIVRDPVMREISAIFHNMNIYHRHLLERKPDRLNAIIEYITEQLEQFKEESDYACTWFDRELKTKFGIDVLKYPFDFSQRFSIINKDNISVLILRQEDMDKTINKAIIEFLSIDLKLTIGRENDAKSKSYAQDYKEIISNLKIKKEVLKRIYASKLVKTFYSEEEINNFTDKWMIR